MTPPGRPGMGEAKMSDTYMQPRAPPQPPPHHAPGKERPAAVHDTSSPMLKPAPSPSLPRWSAGGGDFSMDEDMARILGTDEGSSSILRRVSNAVRHGRTGSVESSHPGQGGRSSGGHNRSVSETTRATVSPRWPKTPIAEDESPNGHGQGHEHRQGHSHGHGHGHAREISSPISLSGGGSGGQDDPAFLKRQLRNSEQRVADLERQFNTEKDLQNLNRRLLENRKTVSVLDTQTEIMIRQIEVLAG